jgi:RHS repeat-associated protein
LSIETLAMSTPRTIQITYGVDQQRIKMEYASYDAWGRHRHPTTWSYTVHNPFGMGGSNDITLRGYTFHEHLHHFSLINMNGRLYDYVLGRMLSPDNYVQSPNSSQSFNRYSYCWNNPLKYTDPSGEIVWMVPIVAAAVFGTGNLLVQASNGEINSWGDGFKAFGSGALAGAAIGTGVSFGLGVPILGTALKFAGWAYAGTTTISAISGLGHGLSTGDWRRLENSAKIFAGNFYLDGNRGFGGQLLQGISRFSWELPQSTIGHGFSQLSNTFNAVNRVDYFGGATFSTNVNSNSRSGVSIGNHINIQNTVNSFDIKNDPLLMHEYGHTFDSQIFGLSYLFVIGIPSLVSAATYEQVPNEEIGVSTHDFRWYEMRANRHAKKYFGERYGVDWNSIYRRGTYETYYPTSRR